MLVSKVSLSPPIQRKVGNTFLCNLGEALRPAPLACGATALSFAAFVSAITGSLSLITVFGAPAIALFACQIFNLMGIQKKDIGK